MSPPSSQASYDGLLDELEDVEEQETATEVEVSEKTLKFKISTEGSVSSCTGRKSCPGEFSVKEWEECVECVVHHHTCLSCVPGSRKGSREKNQYIDNNYELSRMMREECDQRSLIRSTTSDTMESRKNSSDSTTENSKNEENTRRKKEDYRRKSSLKVDKYEYRRKSLAVVERAKERDHTRRRSISTGQEIQRKPHHKKQPMTKHVEIVDDLPETKVDNRSSRDFETSCWGLQNLKKDSTSIEHISCNTVPQIPAEELVKEEVVGLQNNCVKEERHGSLLSKLKSFTDKLSFGTAVEDSANKLKQDNQLEDDKAMTLPKTRKPQKTSSSSKVGKGWKALIGINTRPQKTSSSLELLPPTTDSPSPVRSLNKTARRTSVEDVFERKQVNNNNTFKKLTSSPRKPNFLLKLNKSESSSFEDSASRSKFLNTLTSSFKKRRGECDNRSGGSNSPQDCPSKN
jgi:hypothetical protein